MTPLERAAEAIRNELGDYPVDDMWMTEGGLRSANHYRDLARAVLTAIREPSGAIVGKAMQSDKVVAWGDYREFWQAMIDAMLEEG